MRRSRASKAKVRTGCLTCKTRHLKCDEARPACYRCSEANIQCAGYPPIPARSNAIDRIRPNTRPPALALRMLRPRSTVQSNAFNIKPAMVPQAPIFGSRDFEYFDHFRYRTMTDLAGYLNTNFWKQIVPFKAIDDSSIWLAVLAIGAASKAIISIQAPVTRTDSNAVVIAMPPHPEISQLLGGEHYTAALKYYTRAIVSFRQRLHDSHNPSTYEIIMSLLLLTFEFMQGNLIAADAILTRTLSLFTVDDRVSFPIEVMGMENIIRNISLQSGLTHYCKSQNGAFSHVITPPFRGWQITTPQPSTIDECYREWGSFFIDCISFIVYLEGHDNERDTPSVESRQFILLRCLNAWAATLDKYHESHELPPDVRSGINVLSIQWKLCVILVSCCTDSSEMAYDNFSSEFQDIVTQCHRLIGESIPSDRIPYTFDCSNILAILAATAVKCRHGDVRWDAVKLMKKIPWRDSSWDRNAILCITGLVLIEECYRNSTNGKIPAHGRWSWTDVAFVEGSTPFTAEYTLITSRRAGSVVKDYYVSQRLSEMQTSN